MFYYHKINNKSSNKPTLVQYVSHHEQLAIITIDAILDTRLKCYNYENEMTEN